MLAGTAARRSNNTATMPLVQYILHVRLELYWHNLWLKTVLVRTVVIAHIVSLDLGALTDTLRYNIATTSLRQSARELHLGPIAVTQIACRL